MHVTGEAGAEDLPKWKRKERAMRGKWLGCVVAAAVLPGILCGTAQAIPTFDWSVQYMIDESQSDFGASQATYPRDNRGLAISPDGQYL